MEQQVCYKKRRSVLGEFKLPVRNYTNVDESSSSSPITTSDSLSHKIVDFNIPLVLEDDERSFIRWFNYVKSTLPMSNFVNLVSLHYVNENDTNYCKKLHKYNSKCKKSLKLNYELNEVLLQSIDPQLIHDLSLSTHLLSYCNFERIKVHFQTKINVFYLMALEGDLLFDPTNKLKFLTDLDYLTNVYSLIFGQAPNSDLKVNWILNALNKDFASNNVLLGEIQNNWEPISKDICILRKILMSN
ncbi:hypothetical protein PSN45_002728 [Yamadazyma tenuis]|uniref:Uncharacterized protein n=1 Tax=Candida tenuis (strain ATCC 10573 / BCRC 21748 / CBS 615 / JCM 9827 / NBRC 10315 / NRRL Y-1498 / VKM Y-70) TaxID=590646 RepID=G3AX06_CANTC|nr:uncharacterized protein CANTEDRAFT_112376 [Yamadazyma tenuis ATCC 10573]EGV66654.1 hypothetical protein CANTEDRAFT_112376 [Yamadazyma tenuis ATCC 10573]WEJ95215.1 hypothetical protein PSN45_002728 [Yamadazyma tenuis]